MEKAQMICPVFEKCGGCRYQGAYEEQLAAKQKTTEALLSSLVPVQPILGMENPAHYRNKVHRAFAQEKHGKIKDGLYQEQTHCIVPVDNCFIEDEISQQIIHTVRDLAVSFRFTAFNEDTGEGFLRHVLVRRGFQSGEVMVVLVAASPIFPSKNHFLQALRQAHPEITTVVLNVNAKKTSMILGEENILLFGKGFIRDTLCRKTFRISPSSFYQVNPVQTQALYETAIRLAALSGTETVVDAYSGIGTIALTASPFCRQVIGVELNRHAVRDAVITAKENKVTNARFICEDAGRFMEKAANSRMRADVVFMDPPRSGSTEQFMKSVALLSPKRVVYISCNPETLARDLRFFGTIGYKPVTACPVDMFPYTEHVETVCLLSRLSNTKHHVEVELNLDEMDLTTAESKATYEEIKAYVQEHDGLNVTKFYIAQTKRKYGIIERENYNLPKSEDSKQPQCPPEKEAAIKDALKHFGMI